MLAMVVANDIGEGVERASTLDGLLGTQIGAAGRVLVGAVLLPCELGVVQPTGVAESPGAVGTASPLGSFGAVAAVAAARWSGTTSALLCVAGGEPASGFLGVGGGWWRRCAFGERFLLLALFGGLLVIGDLLCHNDVADLRQCFELETRFGYHVFYLNHAGQ